MNPKVAAILDELTTEVSKMQEKELKINIVKLLLLLNQELFKEE